MLQLQKSKPPKVHGCGSKSDWGTVVPMQGQAVSGAPEESSWRPKLKRGLTSFVLFLEEGDQSVESPRNKTEMAKGRPWRRRNGERGNHEGS